MKLKKLIKDLPFLKVKGNKDVEITGVCSHSKMVAPGNLFVARKGASFDGGKFIPDAVACGAQAVVTDIYDPFLKDVTQVIHPNPSELVGALSSAYYQNPSKDLFVVGITGTNGKTTLSYLIRDFLIRFGMECGLLGTVEYITGKQSYIASLTTPDEISSQRYLREMVLQSCQACVMEVSSHALDQKRVSSVEFDCAIFTNLSHDHLDYHADMEEYFESKLKLFQQVGMTNKSHIPQSSFACVNIDDKYGKRIPELIKVPVLTYGIESQAQISASDITLSPRGSSFILHTPNNSYQVTTPLVGRFNIYNLLAFFTFVYGLGVDMSVALETATNFRATRGRLERVEAKDTCPAYVDYAHTPEALSSILTTLKEFCHGKLICVFGCGGDRDAKKRPIMGKVAADLADFVIVTSDNPRKEEPQNIIDEILSGIPKDKMEKVCFLVDRREAIQRALSEVSSPDDIILLAGKGHENYQLFAHQTLDFDDRLVFLEEANKRACKKSLF